MALDKNISEYQFTGEGLSGFLIERTAKKLKRAFQQALTRMNAGLTADQWVVMDLLANKGALNQHEICSYLAKDPPTVTRIIDILVRKELLQRKTDQDDRRRFLVSLTGKGMDRHFELITHVKQFRKRHFHNLSHYDIELLLDVLEKINHTIDLD